MLWQKRIFTVMPRCLWWGFGRSLAVCRCIIAIALGGFSGRFARCRRCRRYRGVLTVRRGCFCRSNNLLQNRNILLRIEQALNGFQFEEQVVTSLIFIVIHGLVCLVMWSESLVAQAAVFYRIATVLEKTPMLAAVQQNVFPLYNHLCIALKATKASGDFWLEINQYIVVIQILIAGGNIYRAVSIG